ncbi:unnamed protein product [Pylaiella littoralis]
MHARKIQLCPLFGTRRKCTKSHTIACVVLVYVAWSTHLFPGVMLPNLSWFMAWCISFQPNVSCACSFAVLPCLVEISLHTVFTLLHVCVPATCLMRNAYRSYVRSKIVFRMSH